MFHALILKKALLNAQIRVPSPSCKIRDLRTQNPRPEFHADCVSSTYAMRALRLDTAYCWIELAAEEKTLLALEPINLIVPTTRTRITASITAYSAMSCPSSSRHALRKIPPIMPPPP